MEAKNKTLLIGIVGPCGAGKTTLVNALQNLNLQARHIAQEHSYVPKMWQRIAHPDILIFLDASYRETIRRRNLTWTLEEYEEQQLRLSHARANANLYIFTDFLSITQVIEKVVSFLDFHLDDEKLKRK